MLRTVRIAAILLVFACAWMGSASAASANDNCTNVGITFKNLTSSTIKVVEFAYYDYDKEKWRPEALFGLDGNQKIAKGASWNALRSLEHVNNDKTKFRVTFALQSGSKWGAYKTISTASFICKPSMVRTIALK